MAEHLHSDRINDAIGWIKRPGNIIITFRDYLEFIFNDSLKLVAHLGLSKEFIEAVSYYPADSINAQLINKGESLYVEDLTKIQGNLPPDGIKSTSIIPIFYKDKAIACLNMTSHTHDHIPLGIRECLESIALILGGSIARIKSEKQLRESQQNFLSLFNTNC